MRHQKEFKERRIFSDRRKFDYTAYYPERRSGEDRRRVKANHQINSWAA